MQYYETTSVRLATLLNLRTINNVNYHFQNFDLKNVIQWNNNIYEFLPINYTPPTRSVELNNTSLQVTLPNFPGVIQAMDANNGFINSIVQAIILYPDDMNANPISSDLLLVSGSSVQGAAITFELESPVTNIHGIFPNVYFTTGNSRSDVSLGLPGYIPEAPLVLIDKINQ